MSDYPPWQPMETAPKDVDILVIWFCVNPYYSRPSRHVGLARFNGVFEHIKPDPGFWYGYIQGGSVSSRSENYAPIAWMHLPEIT